MTDKRFMVCKIDIVFTKNCKSVKQDGFWQIAKNMVFPRCIYRKSFKCCGISNELDGSEDELFNSALARALSVAAPSDSESDYESDDETDVYYNLD